MPNSPKRLKEEAMKACKRRGHLMTNFVAMSGRFVKYWGRSVCVRCGREVDILERPLPNEISIGGEALAINCSESEPWRSYFHFPNKKPNEIEITKRHPSSPVWVLSGRIAFRIHRAEDNAYTLVQAFRRNHESEKDANLGQLCVMEDDHAS